MEKQPLPITPSLFSLEGFISVDGSMMVLRIIESDDTAGEKFRANGMVIGIRQ
jgi:hypothetical protein